MLEFPLWTFGPWILWAISALMITVTISCIIIVVFYMVDKFEESIIIPLTATFIGAIFLIGGFYVKNYVPPSAQEESYVTQEHQLAAVSNLREQEETTETYSGVLTYASTTTIDNVETIRFIRQQEDERGTYYTVESLPMDDVRLYQSNDEEPVERHWHTRKVATHPKTGEKYYFNDHFDFVEIKVPEGSVAHNYDINLDD